jgi:flagellar protein FliO/FliZ
MDTFLRYFSVILAFIVVLGLLLLTTKYLTYKSKKMMKGNYMHIVESLSLGVNNRLHLVKVDKEFFIISATNKNVEFLAKVNISDFEEEEIKNPISDVIDFKSILKKTISGFSSGNQTAAREAKPEEAEIGRDLRSTDEVIGNDVKNDAMFKSNLEKLKHLTNSMNDRRR